MILSLFIDVESLQVISGFNLKGMKKLLDGASVQKYINHKAMISPLLTCPQGCQRCQKIQKTKLMTTLISWSTKIQSKLNKNLLWQFLFNFDVFSQFLQFWLNFFALQLTRMGFSSVFRIFWHPWHLGVHQAEWKKFWLFRSLWDSTHEGQATSTIISMHCTVSYFKNFVCLFICLLTCLVICATYIPCFLTLFWIFPNLGSILALQTIKILLRGYFDTPWTQRGVSIVEVSDFYYKF